MQRTVIVLVALGLMLTVGCSKTEVHSTSAQPQQQAPVTTTALVPKPLAGTPNTTNTNKSPAVSTCQINAEHKSLPFDITGEAGAKAAKLIRNNCQDACGTLVATAADLMLPEVQAAFRSVDC